MFGHPHLKAQHTIPQTHIYSITFLKIDPQIRSESLSQAIQTRSIHPSMAHDASGDGSGSSSKKRPRAPAAPDNDEEEEAAEELLLEAQALIEGEDPDDTERVVELLERCIQQSASATVRGAVADEGDEEGGKAEVAPVVPSLAHTWLAKIREQQQQEEEAEEEGAAGPVDDSGGPARAEVTAHYEAALACWCVWACPHVHQCGRSKPIQSTLQPTIQARKCYGGLCAGEASAAPRDHGGGPGGVRAAAAGARIHISTD